MIFKKPEKDYYRWRKRFAWYPVRVSDDEIVWLTWYFVRRTGYFYDEVKKYE